MRWTIERTNSWLSNFGQPRRSTDRSTTARLGQLALAVALIITVKLLKWADRWNHAWTPIRARLDEIPGRGATSRSRTRRRGAPKRQSSTRFDGLQVHPGRTREHRNAHSRTEHRIRVQGRQLIPVSPNGDVRPQTPATGDVPRCRPGPRKPKTWRSPGRWSGRPPPGLSPSQNRTRGVKRVSAEATIQEGDFSSPNPLSPVVPQPARIGVEHRRPTAPVVVGIGVAAPRVSAHPHRLRRRRRPRRGDAGPFRPGSPTDVRAAWSTNASNRGPLSSTSASSCTPSRRARPGTVPRPWPAS